MHNREKRLIKIRTATVLSAVFVLWIIIAVSFSNLFIQDVKSSYLSLSAESCDNVMLSVESSLLAVYEENKKFAESGVSFLPISVKTDKNGIIDGAYDEEGLGIPISSKFLYELSVETAKGTFTAITMPKVIFNDEQDSDMYFVTATADENGYYISGVPAKSLFSAINLFGYDDALILVSYGKYAYSVKYDAPGFTELEKLKVLTLDKLNNNEAVTVEADYGKEKAIVGLSTLNSNIPDIRIAVHKNADELNDNVKSVIFKQLLEHSVVFLIFAVGFVILLYIIAKSDESLAFGSTGKIYIVDVNLKGVVKHANRSFRKEFLCKNISGFINTTDESLEFMLRKGNAIVLNLSDVDGEMRSVAMSPLKRFGAYRLVGSDITSLFAEYSILKRGDSFDSVTGMPLEKIFRRKIEKAQAKGGVGGVVAIIKIINAYGLKATLGEHAYGKTLASVSDLIKDEIGNMGTVYYMHNGDFLIYGEKSSDITSVTAVTSSVKNRLSKPINVGGNFVNTEVRIGVAILGNAQKDVNADNLISNALMALDNAAFDKRGFYILQPTNFTANRTNFHQDGIIIEMIENGEITANFQPQFSLKTGKIVGFETLTRIVGEKNREIKVQELIENAEHYGGMAELGEFIAAKAMDFAEEIAEADIAVSVNISPVQIMQQGFTDKILKLFNGRNIKRNMFAVEVTESAALYNFEEVVAKLKTLKEYGIGVHIDDFGVAYSSMLHLKLLPADVLKIDKSLVDDIVYNPDATAIMKSIIGLAHVLGKQVIAEGAESKEQVELLKNIDCDMVQGFATGQAVSANRAAELIKEVNGYE